MGGLTMKIPTTRAGRRRSLILPLLAAALAAAALAAVSSAAERNAYTVHNLVSDQAGVAAHTDTNLVNAWGLDARPTSPWWVADNGTNVSTLYTAAGVAFPPPPASPLVVQVPHAPTGLVANPGSGFPVELGGTSAPALFLFATEEGTILGWNPSVSPDAVVVKDLHSGAIYKGLAVSPSGDRLYATDFHNDRVDVFDGSLAQVVSPGAFVDSSVPAGFAPFGIQAVGARIFVTYAKQDADAEDDVAGQGLGFVDVYDAAGALLGRVAKRGQLNAPWGIALAPDNFGRFSGDLLIGNFGDGRINAFRQQPAGNYEHAGRLRSNGGDLAIDGLWALQFGKGAPNNGAPNTLFFTAGPDDESHGLFGSITAS
jgi:uncharacterized protein (TIGR03118 family)